MIKERGLIELLKEKRIEALKTLYEENYKMIFSIAYKYTNNKEDAEEILQETFVRAFKNIEKFTPENESSLKKWILKICTNISIDYLRKRKLMRIFGISEVQIKETQNIPSSEFEKNEIKDKMDYAISLLSPKQKIAFNLKYIEDFSLKEISEIMECSENTVKKHLQRSVEKVKKYLKKEKLL